MSNDESLTAFIREITAEEFLPLPREVPRDDSEEWDHLTWDDIEPQEDALKRIWSGQVAEILGRDFGWFQRGCVGAMRAEEESPGASWWYVYSEEPLPNDRSILFWTIDGPKKNRDFARRLTLKECETLVRLIADRDMNH